MLKRIIMGMLMIMLIQSSLQAETIPTQENVTKLYVATFKRAPDAAGLIYWVNDSELDLEGIAQSFFDQPETQEAYPPGSTIEDFVIAVYANLFNRTPDQAGLDYWVDELNSGSIIKSVFILAVINGALNTEEFGNDATILSNKTIVGLAYADALLNDVEDALNIMSEITDDFSTVDTALENYDIVYSIDYLSWLAGKTFYTAAADYVDSTMINADVTEASWTQITPEVTAGVNTLLIDGPKLFVYEGDEADGYLVLSVENSDYLEFNIFLLSGAADGVVRFYFNQAKAEAYYESLQPVANTVSFVSDVMPIFFDIDKGSCRSCHTTTSRRTFKVGEPEYTYDNIITNSLINTTSPDLSSILIKGNGGDNHNGGDQLSDVNSKIVRDWIEEGGLNN